MKRSLIWVLVVLLAVLAPLAAMAQPYVPHDVTGRPSPIATGTVWSSLMWQDWDAHKVSTTNGTLTTPTITGGTMSNPAISGGTLSNSSYSGTLNGSGALAIGNVATGGINHPIVNSILCPPSGQAPTYHAVFCLGATSKGVIEKNGPYANSGEYMFSNSFDVVPDAVDLASYAAGYGNDKVLEYQGLSLQRSVFNMSFSVAAQATPVTGGAPQTITISGVTSPIAAVLEGNAVEPNVITGPGIPAGTTILSHTYTATGSTADGFTQTGTAVVTISNPITATIAVGTSLTIGVVPSQDVWVRDPTLFLAPGSVGGGAIEEADANNYECDRCGGHAFFGYWLSGNGWYPMDAGVYVTSANPSGPNWHTGFRCEVGGVSDACVDIRSSMGHPTYTGISMQGFFSSFAVNLSSVAAAPAGLINLPDIGTRAVTFDGQTGGPGTHYLQYSSASAGGMNNTNQLTYHTPGISIGLNDTIGLIVDGVTDGHSGISIGVAPEQIVSALMFNLPGDYSNYLEWEAVGGNFVHIRFPDGHVRDPIFTYASVSAVPGCAVGEREEMHFLDTGYFDHALCTAVNVWSYIRYGSTP